MNNNLTSALEGLTTEALFSLYMDAETLRGGNTLPPGSPMRDYIQYIPCLPGSPLQALLYISTEVYRELARRSMPSEEVYVVAANKSLLSKIKDNSLLRVFLYRLDATYYMLEKGQEGGEKKTPPLFCVTIPLGKDRGDEEQAWT